MPMPRVPRPPVEGFPEYPQMGVVKKADRVEFRTDHFPRPAFKDELGNKHPHRRVLMKIELFPNRSNGAVKFWNDVDLGNGILEYSHLSPDEKLELLALIEPLAAALEDENLTTDEYHMPDGLAAWIGGILSHW